MIIETPKNNYSPLPTSGSLFRIYQIRSNECISYARIQICPLDEPLVIDNVFPTALGKSSGLGGNSVQRKWGYSI